MSVMQGNGKTQTESFSEWVELDELSEDTLFFHLIDTGTCIFDCKEHPCVGRFKFKGNRLVARKLLSIVEQLCEDGQQICLIGMDFQCVGHK